MDNQKRRSFRPRNNNGFRGRGGSRSNKNGHFQNSNGNNNFNRNNGSMTNPFNVEKTILKYQQLAKDAQSMGDPCVVENYLQHADHYSRRLAELNSKSKTNVPNNNSDKETKLDFINEKKQTSSQDSSQKDKD